MKKTLIISLLLLPLTLLAQETNTDPMHKYDDVKLIDEAELIKESRGRMIQSRAKIIERTEYSQKDLTVELRNQGAYGGYHYKVKMLDGIFKGQIVNVDFTLFEEDVFRKPPKSGTKILVGYLLDDNGGITHTAIYGKDRVGTLIILILLFIAGVIALGGKKGILSLSALTISVLLVFVMFIPLVIGGASPLFWGVVVALLATAITFFIITGWSKKSIVATIGSLIGFAIAAILALIFGKILGITGVMNNDMVSLKYTTGIDVGQIIFAGILIGAVGAVMDVAISIASTVEELRLANPNLTSKELFKSSLNVGRDILGTMVNTLIFAYVGTALPFIIMIYIQYAGHTPFINIMNLDKIAEEILRSIVGSLGMVATIPATAFIASYVKIDVKPLKLFKTKKDR